MLMKKSILLIALGILLLAVDIRIPAGEAYPEIHEVEEGLGEELQKRIINHFIGEKPGIDIVSDLAGYILVFIGAVLLAAKSRKMYFALIFIPVAVYLYVTIPMMPYNYEGRELFLKTAGSNFMIVFFEILIEFFVIHGIIAITDCIQNKWQNNELLLGWIAAMFSKGILAGINFFYGRGILYYAYSIVLIGLTLFYLSRLFATLKGKPAEADT